MASFVYMYLLLDKIKKANFADLASYNSVRDYAEDVISENEKLKQQLSLMQKMLFGQKRERYIPASPDQLQFNSLEEEVPLEETIKVPAYTKTKKKNKTHPGRDVLPEHLERKTTIIEPLDLPQDKSNYKQIGTEVKEQLCMNPAHFYVNRIERPKYKKIETDEIICGQLPADLFSRFKADSSVISHILVSKYADHLPLYRINKIFKRSNIKIRETTMVGWIASACDHLTLIYNHIQSTIKNASYILADESPIPVLKKNKSKTHQGYMFVYVIDKVNIFYDYREGRAATGPTDTLAGFSGILMTDGYAGYNDAIKKNKITPVNCMAHSRRKFFEAFELGEKIAERPLELIKALYEIEANVRGKPDCEIIIARNEKSKDIFIELENWCVNNQDKLRPTSKTRVAINYFLNRTKKLGGFLEHPTVDIDNNLCERTIRPMTIGRKNYMFAGSDEGAKRAAIVYSLILTCRHHNIDPYQYFLKVFDLMAKGPEKDVDELLPNKIIF